MVLSIHLGKPANDVMDTRFKDHSFTMPFSPLFFVFGGIPDSGKTSFLNLLMKNFGNEAPFNSIPGFDFGQIIAAGHDVLTQTFSAPVTSSQTLFNYALLSGLLSSSSNELDFRMLQEGNIAEGDDNPLNNFYNSFVKFAKEEYEKINNVSGIFSEDALRSGISLINIWDISINKALFSFLKCYNGCFENGYMCLFIDLERDSPQLHHPPEIDEDIEGSQEMMWRSRLHYLLHSCKVVSNRTNVCKIFARCSSEKSIENDRLKGNVEDVCKFAAKQIGVDDRVNFDVILFDPLEDDADKKVLKHFRDMMLPQNQKRIPVSWVFLRGALNTMKKIIINNLELQAVANGTLNFSEVELDEFCRFYSSFGSIFYIKQNDSSLIIIKPIEFIKKLNTLYTYAASSAAENDPLIRCGIVTQKTAVKFFGQNVALYLNALESVNLAVKVNASSIAKVNVVLNERKEANNICYFIPSIRNGEPVKTLSFNSVHLYVDIMAPIVNLDVAITASLLRNVPNAMLIPVEKMNVTCLSVLSTETLISITCLGDIIEFETGNVKNKEELPQVCEHILTACEVAVKMYSKMTKPKIKYNFGVLCENDDYTDVTYNIYHLRHTLPDHFLCDDCFEEGILDYQVEAWNTALEKVC